MKNALRYSVLFLMVGLIVSSCKKKLPEQTKHIPKDAMFVVDLNWKSLSDKAKSGNINWDSLFKASTSPGDMADVDSARKQISNFIRSGIDTTADIYMYVKMGGSIMTGQSFSAGVIGLMKDASAFEAYLKKQPLIGDIKKESNYSYATLADDKMIVGWNSDIVILTGNESSGRSFDSSGSQSNGAEEQLASLFNLKDEESVASIPEFQDLIKEKGDMLFWSNSSGALNSVPLLGMTKLADLFQDSYGAGVINFENGKVTASFKSYSGKDLAEIWKKYAGPTVNMDMVNQYPSQVQGYVAFSFNPQIITEIIKYAGMEATVNQFLGKENLSLDDITKTFKGDFAIVFSDLGYNEKEYDYNGVKFKTKTPTAKLVFNLAIADKTSYNKIVSKFAQDGFMEMRNGQYVPKGIGDVAWNMDGKNLVIATDSTLLQQYLTGKGNAGIPADIASQSKGKSVAAYFDLSNIIGSFAKDSSKMESLQSAKETFKYFTAGSDNYNGKYVAANMELKLMNDQENSLVSLVKFFAASSQQVIKEERRYEENEMPDTDSTMPSLPEDESK